MKKKIKPSEQTCFDVKNENQNIYGDAAMRRLLLVTLYHTLSAHCLSEEYLRNRMRLAGATNEEIAVLTCSRTPNY